jgi:hypothetical protein
MAFAKDKRNRQGLIRVWRGTWVRARLMKTSVQTQNIPQAARILHR